MQKRPRKESRASWSLQEALRRKREESTRTIYESLIEYEQEHLRDCREPKCPDCKGARALIPYYRAQMLKALARIAKGS